MLYEVITGSGRKIDFGRSKEAIVDKKPKKG